MQKNNRKKRNNKGFSMVELIIVIAIMAALVGILAPQYIKYVAKSKDAADKTQIDEVLKAAKVIATETNMYDQAYTITINTTSLAVSGTGATNAAAHLSSILGSGYASKKLNTGTYVVAVTWNASHEPIFSETRS